MRREREVAKQVIMVRDVRARLARSKISANVTHHLPGSNGSLP